MAKRKVVIQKFNGGMADDVREQSSNKCALSKNFDIFSHPHRMVPHYDMEADENDGSTETGMRQYKVEDFVYATSGKLYGLGRKAASDHTKLFIKATPSTGNWAVPASSESALARVKGCLFEYNDKLLGFESTNKIFEYGDLSGTPTYSANAVTLGATITSVANGLVGRDDQGYMFYNNIVVRVASDFTVTDSALTLPAHLKITSATRYGDYLAIACAPKATANAIDGLPSVVYLWDYTSSDVSETIDFGDGNLMVLETIENQLIGISERGFNSSVGLRPDTEIIFRVYNGGTAQIVKEAYAIATTTSNRLKQYKAVRKSRLYFAASLSTATNGTTFNEGVWSIGRVKGTNNYALALEYIEESATLNNPVLSFQIAGDYVWMAWGIIGNISKTNESAAAFTFTSVWESIKFNGGDINKTKRLVGVAVSKATTTGQVVVKYKTEADSDFVTIHTMATGSAVSQELIKIVSTGKNLPEFQEIQFRLESTTGAEITGFKFVYEDDVKNLLTTV